MNKIIEQIDREELKFIARCIANNGIGYVPNYVIGDYVFSDDDDILCDLIAGMDYGIIKKGDHIIRDYVYPDETFEDYLY